MTINGPQAPIKTWRTTSPSSSAPLQMKMNLRDTPQRPHSQSLARDLQGDTPPWTLPAAKRQADPFSMKPCSPDAPCCVLLCSSPVSLSPDVLLSLCPQVRNLLTSRNSPKSAYSSSKKMKPTSEGSFFSSAMSLKGQSTPYLGCFHCRGGVYQLGRGHGDPAHGHVERHRRSLDEAGGEAGDENADSAVRGHGGALSAPAAALQGNAASPAPLIT